jgi:hypothetical protein
VCEEEEIERTPSPGTSAAAPTRSAHVGSRRQNVFVEAVEIDADWVAPSYPHTEEEEARLHGYVSKTVLLAHLDQQAKQTVIAAFQKLSFRSGQAIITQARPPDPQLQRTRSGHIMPRGLRARAAVARTPARACERGRASAY